MICVPSVKCGTFISTFNFTSNLHIIQHNTTPLSAALLKYSEVHFNVASHKQDKNVTSVDLMHDLRFECRR